MSANDLLTLLSHLCFVLLGFVTLRDYLRHRDKPRGDIALMFGSLALTFFIPDFLKVIRVHFRLLDLLGSIALVAQPYLLLRLLRYFYPVSPRFMKLARLILVGLWAALILADRLTQFWAMLGLGAIIVYFAIVDGYAMGAFVRGALRSSGVIRYRLRFAAAGSGLLASALVALGIAVAVPAFLDVLTGLTFLLIVASALTYYIGFAPPRWLRRAWQLTELRSFLLRISSKPVGERLNVQGVLDELCQSAYLAVGGIAALVAKPNQTGDQWTLHHTSDHPEFASGVLDDDGVAGRVSRERHPLSIRASDLLNENDRDLLEIVQADTLLVAPITSTERSWGLLLVFLPHSSLFIDDDLELVMLLAQQSAVFLENSTLVEEMHHYSEQLEENVLERTRELSESRAQYRRLLETAQEGVWVTDADNKTTFVNARLVEMLGYTTDEFLAASFSTFMDEEGLATSHRNQERRREGIKENFEFKFRRKDGSDLFTLVAATPLTNETGAYSGTLAMIADITERKQAEAEILKLNGELEQRVLERTAQLRVANQELEAFSYSVSHDLRAPLRTMDGFSKMLLNDYQDILDEQGQHFLNRIRAGSENMGQLIDALLHLSRVSRTELQFEPLNLSALVCTIQNEIQEQNPVRHVECVCEDNLVSRGDRGLIRIVLTNLLTNAWKFTRKQSLARIEFGSEIHEGQQVYFVRDNGVGFDMAYADKLFGAFQRLHNVNEFEGTGIGLATVERIIHRHGGKIWVEAAVNQGAAFYFTLKP